MKNKTDKVVEVLVKQFDVLRGPINPSISFNLIAAAFFVRVSGLEAYKDHIVLEEDAWVKIAQADNPVKALSKVLEKIEKDNNQFKHLNYLVEDALRSKSKFDAEFKKVCQNLDSIDLSGVNLSSVIEVFSATFFGLQGKRGGAESVTPLDIKHLVESLLSKDSYESAYDPCIGTGTFLTIGPDKIKSIYANEINLSTYALSGIFHFIAGNFDFNLEDKNSLVHPFVEGNSLKKFDLVISFPPFGMRLRPEELKSYKNDEWNRFHYGVSNDTSWLFVEHILSVLEDKGEAFVALPFGALFSTGFNREIRKGLVDAGVIDTVIQLPDRMFYNTAIPVALVVLKKDRPKNEPIYFIKATDLGKIHKAKRYLDNEDVDQIVKAYKSADEIDGFARLVNINEVLNEDYNLMPNRYIWSGDDNEEVNINDIVNALEESSNVAFESRNLIGELLGDYGVKLS